MSELPEIFPVNIFTGVTGTKQLYEPHPDGGLTPIEATDKGDLTIRCPACEGPLARDVSLDTWKKTVIRCPNTDCGRIFSGEYYPPRIS